MPRKAPYWKKTKDNKDRAFDGHQVLTAIEHRLVDEEGGIDAMTNALHALAQEGVIQSEADLDRVLGFVRSNFIAERKGES